MFHRYLVDLNEDSKTAGLLGFIPHLLECPLADKDRDDIVSIELYFESFLPHPCIGNGNIKESIQPVDYWFTDKGNDFFKNEMDALMKYVKKYGKSYGYKPKKISVKKLKGIVYSDEMQVACRKDRSLDRNISQSVR